MTLPAAAAIAILCSVCLSAQTFPFVGCTTYGQSKVFPPPAQPTRVVRLAPAAALKLAYYESTIGPGVLAPRDWSCECQWGSDGTLFHITPQVADLTKREINSAAIEVSMSPGDNSGRYEIAEVIARIFPEQWAWARQTVLSVFDVYDLKYGPYPVDRLTYKKNQIAEYRTPPNSEGLGTRGYLKPNANPIEGVVILQGNPPDRLFRLAVRLPPGMRSLTPQIIQDFEASTSPQP